MPLYYYRCPGCSRETRRMLKPTEAVGRICDDCGAGLERNPHPPSTQVMETLDSGFMPRRLERLRDAETLFRERAKAGPKSKE